MKFTSYEHLKDYLLKAALGHVPMPISTENLEKAYAHFKGAYTKETVLRITSRLDILLNLVPATREILPRITENEVKSIHEFVAENALHESEFKFTSSHEVRHALLELQDEQYHMLAKVFRNPDQVAEALNSTTKKEWMIRLHEKPNSMALLSASAGLSSEEFFERQLHLAFMAVEPNIYGPFHTEHAHLCFHVSRLYRKQAQLKQIAQKLEEEERKKPLAPAPKSIQQQEETPAKIAVPEKVELPKAPLAAEEPKETLPRQPKVVYTPPAKQVEPKEEKPQQEAPKKQKRPAPAKLPEIKKEAKKEEPLLTTYTKKRKPSTNLQAVADADLESALSKELGTSINLSPMQKDALISSAKELVFEEKETRTKKTPLNFLHKENVIPNKQKLTLETINLSKKADKIS